MTTYPYFNAWLQCLVQLAPPLGLLHVGAGGGTQPYPYASLSSLLAVEADAKQHARLQSQLHEHAHCQVVQAVVAAQDGKAEFFTLSQTLESGLCPSTDLKALWPNIKTLHAEALSTTSLQTLLAQAPAGPTGYNWALIDCLPANELIQGAGDLVQGWDVLVVRALKDAPAGSSSAEKAMGLVALRQQLAAFDLEFVAHEEENHPQMVRALFVRNPAQQQFKDKATFTAALQEQTRLTIESQRTVTALQAQQRSLEQEKSNLTAANEELTAARDQLGLQRDAEAQAKAEALAQRDLLAQDRASFAAARDEQAKLAAERQAALTNLQAQYEGLAEEKSNLTAANAELTAARDQLGLQRDSEAQAKAEAQAQRDQLAQDKAALAAARDEQANLAAERQAALAKLQAQHEGLAQEKTALIAAGEEMINAATSKQQYLQQLEAVNQENAFRQRMQQEELIKAEAQIDLIKDLLLREPGI